MPISNDARASRAAAPTAKRGDGGPPTANPISDLQTLARAPLGAARDLAVIAQALQTLPEISAAVEPLPGVVSGIRNVPGIEHAAASLPDLVDAVQRVPTIEALVLSLIAALESALADVTRVTEIIDANTIR